MWWLMSYLRSANMINELCAINQYDLNYLQSARMINELSTVSFFFLSCDNAVRVTGLSLLRKLAQVSFSVMNKAKPMPLAPSHPLAMAGSHKNHHPVARDMSNFINLCRECFFFGVRQLY